MAIQQELLNRQKQLEQRQRELPGQIQQADLERRRGAAAAGQREYQQVSAELIQIQQQLKLMQLQSQGASQEDIYRAGVTPEQTAQLVSQRTQPVSPSVLMVRKASQQEAQREGGRSIRAQVAEEQQRRQPPTRSRLVGSTPPLEFQKPTSVIVRPKPKTSQSKKELYELNVRSKYTKGLPTPQKYLQVGYTGRTYPSDVEDFSKRPSSQVILKKRQLENPKVGFTVFEDDSNDSFALRLFQGRVKVKQGVIVEGEQKPSSSLLIKEVVNKEYGEKKETIRLDYSSEPQSPSFPVQEGYTFLIPTELGVSAGFSKKISSDVISKNPFRPEKQYKGRIIPPELTSYQQRVITIQESKTESPKQFQEQPRTVPIGFGQTITIKPGAKFQPFTELGNTLKDLAEDSLKAEDAIKAFQQRGSFLRQIPGGVGIAGVRLVGFGARVGSGAIGLTLEAEKQGGVLVQAFNPYATPQQVQASAQKAVQLAQVGEQAFRTGIRLASDVPGTSQKAERLAGVALVEVGTKALEEFKERPLSFVTEQATYLGLPRVVKFADELASARSLSPLFEGGEFSATKTKALELEKYLVKTFGPDSSEVLQFRQEFRRAFYDLPRRTAPTKAFTIADVKAIQEAKIPKQAVREIDELLGRYQANVIGSTTLPSQTSLPKPPRIFSGDVDVQGVIGGKQGNLAGKDLAQEVKNVLGSYGVKSEVRKVGPFKTSKGGLLEGETKFSVEVKLPSGEKLEFVNIGESTKYFRRTQLPPIRKRFESGLFDFLPTKQGVRQGNVADQFRKAFEIAYLKGSPSVVAKRIKLVGEFGPRVLKGDTEALSAFKKAEEAQGLGKGASRLIDVKGLQIGTEKFFRQGKFVGKKVPLKAIVQSRLEESSVYQGLKRFTGDIAGRGFIGRRGQIFAVPKYQSGREVSFDLKRLMPLALGQLPKGRKALKVSEAYELPKLSKQRYGLPGFKESYSIPKTLSKYPSVLKPTTQYPSRGTPDRYLSFEPPSPYPVQKVQPSYPIEPLKPMSFYPGKYPPIKPPVKTPPLQPPTFPGFGRSQRDRFKFKLKGKEKSILFETRKIGPARYGPSLTGIARELTVRKTPKGSFAGTEVRRVVRSGKKLGLTERLFAKGGNVPKFKL